MTTYMVLPFRLPCTAFYIQKEKNNCTSLVLFFQSDLWWHTHHIANAYMTNGYFITNKGNELIDNWVDIHVGCSTSTKQSITLGKKSAFSRMHRCDYLPGRIFYLTAENSNYSWKHVNDDHFCGMFFFSCRTSEWISFRSCVDTDATVTRQTVWNHHLIMILRNNTQTQTRIHFNVVPKELQRCRQWKRWQLFHQKRYWRAHYTPFKKCQSSVNLRIRLFPNFQFWAPVIFGWNPNWMPCTFIYLTPLTDEIRVYSWFGFSFRSVRAHRNTCH